jgi:hypothetical protein
MTVFIFMLMQKVQEASAGRIFMQPLLAAWTFNLDKQHGHAACTVASSYFSPSRTTASIDNKELVFIYSRKTLDLVRKQETITNYCSNSLIWIQLISI